MASPLDALHMKVSNSCKIQVLNVFDKKDLQIPLINFIKSHEIFFY